MTTKFSFFTKLFEENEKSKHLYKDLDFENISPNQLYLLDKLSIISKYKQQVKSLLLRRKIPEREKVNYILLYKPNLNYAEYIKFNNMIEDDEISFIHSLYVMGIFNFCAFMYLIVKKEVNQSIMKEMSFAFMMSILSAYGFHQYNKRVYRKKLSELYFNLENRMNEFPEMKLGIQNKNYVSEDNYDDELEDNI